MGVRTGTVGTAPTVPIILPRGPISKTVPISYCFLRCTVSVVTNLFSYVLYVAGHHFGCVTDHKNKNKSFLLQVWSHHYKSFKFVTMNSWIVNYGVYINTMRNNLLNNHVIVFSSFVYPGRGILWVFLEEQWAFILPVHLVYAPRFWCRPGYSFTGVSLCVLFWLLHVLCCVCSFSLGLHAFDNHSNLGPLD